MIMVAKTAQGEHAYVKDCRLYRMALCNRMEVMFDEINLNQNSRSVLEIL